ncbi:hypothetical protein M7I_2799 [Glarea lozoyensis 74030]|uniref:Uncharacterized protein n=1 Tax=Glarea lozoyensis (strain ATCC 74030 / MF5533) TaxID=1104152 RepID=H0EJR9_GLAL7|nr:hypothetical protein M7I_2799 [Glarea lozoyensis 74030]
MALSAPTGVHETYALSVVIAVVSVLSAVGAGWIILSFLLFEGQRTFRHQLILMTLFWKRHPNGSE